MKGSPERLRILHTTPFVPLPPDSGGKLVPYHHLAGLARKGHRITFVAPIRRPGDSKSLSGMPGSISVLPVPCRSLSPVSAAIHFAMKGESIRVLRHTLPAVGDAVHRLLARESFDVAILDSLFTGYLQPILKRAAPRMPVLLVDHNAESVLFERFLDRRSVPVRFAGRLELARIRQAETSAVRAADLTIALSEEDRHHLLALVPDAAITTLPPGAPVLPGKTIPPPSHEKTVLFLGNYRWEPNREAARWLVEEIFPRVRRKIPDAVLHLAGEDPAGLLRQYHRPDSGVRVLGWVADTSAAIREAALCVVPMRVGGGVRLKILEALANERAVVTTTLGGEGIPLVHGKNAIIADDAGAIAAETAALLHDRERAGRIAREGRRLVEKEFGWDAIVARLDSIVRQLAADHFDALSTTR